MAPLSARVCVRARVCALTLDRQVIGCTGGELWDGWRLSPVEECREEECSGRAVTTSHTEPNSFTPLIQTSVITFHLLSFFCCFSPPCSSFDLSSPLSLNHPLPRSHFLPPRSLPSPVSSLAPLHIPFCPIPADVIVVNLSSIHGDGDL